MTASTRRELRSAATSTSTTAIGLIRALTDARPIKPTSTRCLSARRPNPGRGSTYRRGNSVQTTAATSFPLNPSKRPRPLKAGQVKQSEATLEVRPSPLCTRRAEHFLLTSIVNYSWRDIFWTRPARANDHGKANQCDTQRPAARRSDQLAGRDVQASAAATSRAGHRSNLKQRVLAHGIASTLASSSSIIGRREVQTTSLRRRRAKPRRPPAAKIRPGRPAPTMGPGTGLGGDVELLNDALI